MAITTYPTATDLAECLWKIIDAATETERTSDPDSEAHWFATLDLHEAPVALQKLSDEVLADFARLTRPAVFEDYWGPSGGGEGKGAWRDDFGPS